MNPSRQPWLHQLVATLQAPTVALSDADGQIRAGGTQGVLHADIRVLSSAVLKVGGAPPEPVAGGFADGSDGRFTGLVRSLGDGGADPTVRIERVRRVSAGEVTEEIRVISYAQSDLATELTLDLAADLARVEAIKSGRAGGAGTAIKLADHNADSLALLWGSDDVEVIFHATGTGVAATTDDVSATIRWPVDLPAAGVRTLRWTLRASVRDAPVVGAAAVAADWADVQVNCDDHRLLALVKQSLADLAGLRMAPADAPEDVFLAAGAPWFFTLFGRDSIWAARLLGDPSGPPPPARVAASTTTPPRPPVRSCTNCGRPTRPTTVPAPGNRRCGCRRCTTGRLTRHPCGSVCCTTPGVPECRRSRCAS
jgi:hypothetical protein